ncbi:MAG: septum formation protein Maf [Marivivens sp.]|jgi:septum formation protein|nr:Maf family protein [Marivivens geojensis]NBQ50981.1 septum formation protein Maf [Marivivens sp.]NBT52085.1 septum formation protein Maf [Marivivens sp.]NBX09413.1 septum formation protein Maf [Marivivens sp.]NCW69305.1 septum formation protein Maf [Marivivens sp.]
MADPIILASSSEIRATLLRNAGVPFTTEKPRVDEEMIRASLEAEEASPRDIADFLAEAKARKVSLKANGALVIGCDQVLDFDGTVMSKPADPSECLAQLTALRGKTHRLLSAAVIYKDGEPLWRHVGVVRLTMREFSDDYLSDYVVRNWESVRWSVGGYKLEEEGVRLMSRIEGDYFNVLGLPMIELLNYLTVRGALPA